MSDKANDFLHYVMDLEYIIERFSGILEFLITKNLSNEDLRILFSLMSSFIHKIPENLQYGEIRKLIELIEKNQERNNDS